MSTSPRSPPSRPGTVADALAAKYAGLATRIVLYNALNVPERVERYGEVARRLQSIAELSNLTRG